MPIVNGVYQPWTCPAFNATQGFTAIPSCIVANLPWAFVFFLIVAYIIFFIVNLGKPGRQKYVVITRNGMITAALMGLFGLFGSFASSAVIVGAAAGLFFVTNLIVIAGGD